MAPARLRMVPASQPTNAHRGTASVPPRVVEQPESRTDRPSPAPPLRLTRDRTTLSSLLQANLASPAAGPGLESLAAGLERRDGAPPWSWPPDPVAWTSDGERMWAGPGDHPPVEIARRFDGLDAQAADAAPRPDFIQQPDTLPPSAPSLEGLPARRALGRSTAPRPIDRRTDELAWPVQTMAGPSGSPRRPGSRSAPADTSAPMNGRADAARLPDDTLRADPSGPDAQEGLADRLLVRRVAPAAGAELTVDEVLEALADRLELALLRAYGTSGG